MSYCPHGYSPEQLAADLCRKCLRARRDTVEREREALFAEVRGLRERVQELESPRSYLPPGKERDEALALAKLREMEIARRSEYDRAEALTKERDEAQWHLGNLLARIHRDGGQYHAAHGTEKAVSDADRISAERTGQIDELRAEVERARRQQDRLALLESALFWQLERRWVGLGAGMFQPDPDAPPREVYRVSIRHPNPSLARVRWTDDCPTAADALDEALLLLDSLRGDR
jgi:hypothetical protein